MTFQNIGRVDSTALPLPRKEVSMTALQTVAEQILEFGSFVYTYKEDSKTHTDVYKIDGNTMAQIKCDGMQRVIQVTFTK